jgi:hypothetical protein
MDNDGSQSTTLYVNVYCDWEAWGPWDRCAWATHAGMLPIPRELGAWILGWQARFEAIPIEEIVEGVSPGHQREGEAIVAALRVLLPGWTVDFHADAHAAP